MIAVLIQRQKDLLRRDSFDRQLRGHIEKKGNHYRYKDPEVRNIMNTWKYHIQKQCN